MFPYIIMFAHFLISLGVIFFAYRALASYSKINIKTHQVLLAALALTVPAFAVTLFNIPAIVWIIIGAVILFFLQKSYIKDDKINAMIVWKSAIILVLIIILILIASDFILK